MPEERGFTLIEVIIAVGIVITLLSVITFNLLRTQRTFSLTSTIDVLKADIKGQQLKAMVGRLENGVKDNFGIYFLPNGYILFRGASFDPSDTTNFQITLDTGAKIASTTLPNNTLVFSQLSGEIQGFTPSNNSVTIESIEGGEVKILELNQYGVVVGQD